MIREFNGKKPKIADSAFVSEWAYVVGDVEIGEGTGVWPGAVIRGDFGQIKIGENCQVEDNCVLHAGTNMIIGNNVIVGHNAVVHCLKIGDNVLIGNNATILDYSEIGEDSVIGANSMVPTGKKIPGNSLAVGIPARIKGKLPHRPIDKIYPGFNRRLEVNGEKGSIVLEEDTIASWDIEGQEMPESVVIGKTSIGAASDPADISIEGHVLQLKDMIDAIKNDRKPLVDQYEGKKPVEIILAAYESSKKGRRIDLKESR